MFHNFVFLMFSGIVPTHIMPEMAMHAMNNKMHNYVWYTVA